jgi:hypothetical protein
MKESSKKVLELVPLQVCCCKSLILSGQLVLLNMATIMEFHFKVCKFSPQTAITLRTQTLLYILVILGWEFKFVAGECLQPKFSCDTLGLPV